MIRVLCLVAGLFGAAGLSQFPEFSQQYLQRLGGYVDALADQLMEFDAVALEAGYGREEMLQQMAQTPPMDGQAAMWRRTVLRHAQLSDDLNALRAASPLERLMMPQRVADTDLARAVWSDFRPGMPLTGAGAISAGAGFAGGWALLAALLALITAPMRRARKPSRKPVQRAAPAMKADAAAAKSEPPVARPRLVAQTPSHIPRLSGVKR
ncbi:MULTISPECIES: DUF2937 family protein [unclassified Yoonia]|uniref:DUF2937 family protein n=1 Tax=unclassified Yoonia TaxID=2629118 RepID=UPI002AFEAC17|nr:MULTISPECIES: DUF2937 family protein [unclassified Yoonia]